MKKIIILLGGLLLLTASPVYGASIFYPFQGGTGSSATPSYGQILLGTSGGVFALSATSTLGISSQLGQLGELSDVATTTPMNFGDILIYNTNTSNWESVATSTLNIALDVTGDWTGTLDGFNANTLLDPGELTLGGIGDVSTTTLAAGNYLIWNAANSLWTSVSATTTQDYWFNNSGGITGNSNIATVGTLTSGSTGTGFTLNFTDSTLSGVIPLANGGTAKALSAAAGGVVYTDSDSFEVLGAGSQNQLLQSNGAAAPSWVSDITVNSIIAGVLRVSGLTYEGTDLAVSGNLLLGNGSDTATSTFDTEADGDLTINTENSTNAFILKDTTGYIGVASTSPFAVLGVENTGSGLSFAVNDVANDATPFVIDASGLIAIGTATTLANTNIYAYVPSGGDWVTRYEVARADNADDVFFTFVEAGTTTFTQWFDASADRMWIEPGTASGNDGIFVNSSGQFFALNGVLGKASGDPGNSDIWGISADFYPSHGTAASQYGISWQATANAISFIGAGVEKLNVDVDTTGNITMVAGGGNVGIGVTSPTAKLELNNSHTQAYTTAWTDGTSESLPQTYDGLAIINDNSSAGFASIFMQTDDALTGTGRIQLVNTGSKLGDFAFSLRNGTDSMNEAMRITGGGNVGIGDASPASMLTVGNGDLFQVNSSGAIVAITGLSGATGAYDLGGVTSFEIPNGASPTVDAIGEFALDTTDNQLVVATSTTSGAEAVIRTNEKIFSFSMASTSPEWFDGGSLPVPPEKDGYTIKSYSCYVTSGTSVVMTPSDGSNDMDSITCGTTITTDTAMAKGSRVTAGELIQMKIGAITGAVDYVSFSAFGVWVRE